MSIQDLPDHLRDFMDCYSSDDEYQEYEKEHSQDDDWKQLQTLRHQRDLDNYNRNLDNYNKHKLYTQHLAEWNSIWSGNIGKNRPILLFNFIREHNDYTVWSCVSDLKMRKMVNKIATVDFGKWKDILKLIYSEKFAELLKEKIHILNL